MYNGLVRKGVGIRRRIAALQLANAAPFHGVIHGVLEIVMNRDPINFECTRDPIFVLQKGRRQWSQIPGGLESDGESLWVEDASLVDVWIKQFIVDGSVDTTEEFWQMAESTQNDHGWPMVYVEWFVESVFLKRQEAEEYAKSCSYRWDKWRVYCVPCDGELAKILDACEPTALVG